MGLFKEPWMTPTLSYKTKGILVIFPIGSKSGTLDLDTSLLFTVAMFFTTMIETTIVKVSSEVKLANRDQPFTYPELDLHKLKWLWSLLVLNGKLIIENSFPPSPSCMDLVAELSTNPKAHKEVITLMSLVAEAAHYKHYTQHLHLLETVCTQVNQLGNIIM